MKERMRGAEDAERRVSGRRIWGWYFFDWASQPYSTLLITFIFAPYMNDLLGDGTTAQTVWGYGIGAAGLVVAALSPLLGTIADRAGGRMGFIWLFSALYVAGSAGLWWAEPGNYNLWLVMVSFAIGMIGMELATTFTNAMLPGLGAGGEQDIAGAPGRRLPVLTGSAGDGHVPEISAQDRWAQGGPLRDAADGSRTSGSQSTGRQPDEQAGRGTALQRSKQEGTAQEGTAQARIGRISGAGWAFGYLGGLVSLLLMLGIFQIDPATGRTLLGLPPLFGLDLAAREDTRIVGPLTAVWYAVFMIPFFLWLREAPQAGRIRVVDAARAAWPSLRTALAALPQRRSFAAFLGASMLYRDALNGIFVFGGLYAAGVLGWSVIDVGIFGILGATTGAAFAWLGGRADGRWGPKPVIVATVAILTLAAVAVVFISREAVFGIAVLPESRLPDLAFYAIGGAIGACAGALQSASRSMMVRQSDPARMTESFGLYALAGKATSFVAPLSIGAATQITGSQQAGITPLIVLFLGGLLLLRWVDPEGDRHG